MLHVSINIISAVLLQTSSCKLSLTEFCCGCTRMSKFRVVDEVKQKVLSFLLQNAEDLLVTAGCPIKKVNKRVFLVEI